MSRLWASRNASIPRIAERWWRSCLAGPTRGATLAQLGAFASGESDAAPGLGPVSGSRLEKILARLFAQGSGTPLLYRRLLVEAMRAVAPRSWAEIKLRPGADRWFASSEALDGSVLAEVRASATSPPSAGEPLDLSASLALVSAYQVLARCAGPAPTNDCRRADQMRRMLESSGPLVARRRVQDVWATPCSNIANGVMKEWLRDVPPTRTSAGRGSRSGDRGQALHLLSAQLERRTTVRALALEQTTTR